MNQATDDSLLHRYRETGDQQAFASIVERHLPMVFGTAIRDPRRVDRADFCKIERTFRDGDRLGRFDPGPDPAAGVEVTVSQCLE